MSTNPARANPQTVSRDDAPDPDPTAQGRLSRRNFLVGLAGTTMATAACRTAVGNAAVAASPGSAPQAPLAGVRSATPAELQNLVGDGRRRRILLRGGVVLSLDRKVGDFEKADVL